MPQVHIYDVKAAFVTIGNQRKAGTNIHEYSKGKNSSYEDSQAGNSQGHLRRALRSQPTLREKCQT